MTRITSSMLIVATLVLHMAQGVPLVVENNVACNTSECYALAEGILSAMDRQVDPCVDFHAYACGGYEAFEEIPAHRNSIDTFYATIEQNRLVMRHILEPNSSHPFFIPNSDPVALQNLQKLRDLYSSCMNEDQLKSLGRQPLLSVLQNIIDMFPVNDTVFPFLQSPRPNETKAEAGLNKTGLALTLSYLNKLGLDTLVRFKPGVAGSVNSSQIMLGMFEGGAGLQKRKYYQDENMLDIYKSAITTMLGLIMEAETKDGSTLEEMSNATPETVAPSLWEDTAQQIIGFEKRLSETFTDYLPSIVNVFSPYEVSASAFTAEEISTLTPSINWVLLLDDLLPTDVNRNHRIVVVSPEYQRGLEKLLQAAEPRTLQAYFVWSAIWMLARSLAPMYESPMAALQDSPEYAFPERWMHCVEVVNEHLGHMAGYFFMSERFKNDSYTLVTEMVESIRSIYDFTIPSLSWLDPPTIAGAMEKVKALFTLVGFSRSSPNDQSSESLQSYYEDYHVDPGHFFENEIQFRQWRSAIDIRSLERRFDHRTHMPFSPQRVNAMFEPHMNRIVLPAAMVQPPFFHVDYPEYVNYGSLGTIIGHEFTWWTNTTAKAFVEKAMCFVNQYNKFTVTTPEGKEYKVNGARTVSENIADNGSVRQAFAAWQTRFMSDLFGTRYRNFMLPGLEEYTPEQLFFISFGRSWCSKMRPEMLVEEATLDYHSPRNWRLNGALQNSAMFARAFHCQVGSPMNPQEKCQIW
ncbi:hypothetical protein BGZ67_010538 [Mortierella alpina]|nr:hypothetical protein BGZ67_010538 [Mortierella alpina]